jgi:Na+-translocating ferredoxin:NAD+ oxidoreductase RnfG subunit
MRWTSASICGVMGLLSITETPVVCAKQYVSVEEVKHILFPGEMLEKREIKIQKNIEEKVRRESGVRHRISGAQFWKSKNGSWLVIDEVVGKHEMITYAIGVSKEGVIKGVEILEYNESYGGEIREMEWRNQFIGKKYEEPIKLNQDIRNITGATLSAKHVTDGVRRVMVLYREILSGMQE